MIKSNYIKSNYMYIILYNVHAHRWEGGSGDLAKIISPSVFIDLAKS